MWGVIFGLIAGAIMSVQGVWNTRLGDRIGLFEANTFVQGTAFIFALIVMLIWGNGNIKKLFSVDNKLYLLGGLLGIIITVSVILSMQKLSPAIAISSILISQLLTAAIIDGFGLFDTEKVPFGTNKYIGLVMLVCGIIIFKLK